jgi:hypothetical protein
MSLSRRGIWWIVLVVALGSVASCTTPSDAASSSAPEIDRSRFTQVKQLAVDQGFSQCSPQQSLNGAAMTWCAVPVAKPANRRDVFWTQVEIHAARGYDGLAELDAVAAGCPKWTENTSHGWIWAGDGYFIQVLLDVRETEPTPAEQSIKAALGEALCTS